MNNNRLSNITIVLILSLSTGASFGGKNNQQLTKKIEKVATPDTTKKPSAKQQRKEEAAKRIAQRELEKMKNIEKKPHEASRTNPAYFVELNIANMYTGQGNDRFGRTRSKTKKRLQKNSEKQILQHREKPKKEVYPAPHQEIDLSHYAKSEFPTNMQTGQGLYPIYFPTYCLKED